MKSDFKPITRAYFKREIKARWCITFKIAKFFGFEGLSPIIHSGRQNCNYHGSKVSTMLYPGQMPIFCSNYPKILILNHFRIF